MSRKLKSESSKQGQLFNAKHGMAGTNAASTIAKMLRRLQQVATVNAGFAELNAIKQQDPLLADLLVG